MPNDPYYRSREWRALRQQALVRDMFTCTVPGCGAQASVVDHIVSRRAGGRNELSNLRCLCVPHDNAVKENSVGKRRSGGEFKVKGCDQDGWPLAAPPRRR